MRCLIVLPVLLLAACSSGPPAPEKGTPAFSWAAAKETFSAGDYLKTSDHLAQTAKTSNEFTDRALAWQLVLMAGLAAGYADLADAFENGSLASKVASASLRRQMNDSRTRASQTALSFAENFLKFRQAAKDGSVTLAFPFPEGVATPVAQLAKIAAGALPAAPELEDIQKRVLSRAVLLAACQAAGAPDDAPKARELFKSGSLDVPRAQFLVAMASRLHDQTQLYTKQKLGQPDRVQLFCDQALETLKSVPESKQTKDLTARIQATLKKLKGP